MSTGRESIQGVQEASELDNEIENEELDDEEIDDSDENEETEPAETPRETVERVLKEAQKESDGETDQPSKGADKPERPVKPGKETAAQAKPAPQVEAPILPPTRLKAEAKQLFTKLPKDLQAEWARIAKQEEAEFTRSQQEVAAARNDAKHIVEAVRPYLLAHPELQAAGYTESGIVSALIASHQKLTNPKTALETWMGLGAEIGIEQADLEAIRAAYQGNAPQRAPSIHQDPQFLSLQNEVNALKSAKVQETIAPIVSEMEATRQKIDPQTGQYLYPELHDNQFLEQAKPLVSALVRTVPNLSYSEALVRAHASLTGRSFNGNSNQPFQTKLPAKQITPPRATSAAVSVRGKSAPNIIGEIRDIPKEALGSARDSAKWALEYLRKGN